MTFGLILLGIIVVLSVIGSVIPQSQHAMTYVNQYPSMYRIILALGFDHIFTSWYFLLISALLCVNLTLCSVIRFRSVLNHRVEIEKAAQVPAAGLDLRY